MGRRSISRSACRFVSEGTKTSLTLLAATTLSACAALGPGALPPKGVDPLFTFPVTNNDTPYSACLADLRQAEGDNLPVFAVGEVADKTGQFNYDENGQALSQGATEMVISALHKSGKVRLVERYDLRLVDAELALKRSGLIAEPAQRGSVAGADFIVTGALTELNYNILSDGVGLWIDGIGAGARGAVINVALDLRVIRSDSLEVAYVSSLQKQIFGHEVEANIFSFFGSTLVEFDAGRIRNEPLQLGVRSVVEMAVYQVMTDYLGLPASGECALVRNDPPTTFTNKEKS